MFGLICHRKKQQLSLRAELWALGPALTSPKADPGLAAKSDPALLRPVDWYWIAIREQIDLCPFFMLPQNPSFPIFFHIAITAPCPAKLPGFPAQADCRFSLLRGKLPVHPSGPGQAEAPQDLPSSELLSEIWSLWNGCGKTQKLVLGSCITFISEHFVAGKWNESWIYMLQSEKSCVGEQSFRASLLLLQEIGECFHFHFSWLIVLKNYRIIESQDSLSWKGL